MIEIETFQQLDLSPQVLRGLNRLRFEHPTDVQQAAIGPMLDGRDLLVQAPTGTGKTCAFGIPVVEHAEPGCRQIQTVVLCPTRELAIQTAGVLKALVAFKPGVRVQAVYGGEPIGRQIAALRRKPQILVATPGRLMDLMKRRVVRLVQVDQIVLDEADRMLDMGFRDDINTILSSVPDERQTVLFSATLSGEIKRIATEYQSEAEEIRIRQKTLTVEQVTQYYGEVKKGSKTPVLLELLEQEHFGLALVFVATKAMAERLAVQLGDKGVRAAALHGDMRQSQRNAVMDRYRKGRVNVLVATDVAARGIDVHNIDAVINYDIPGDLDSYVHRIGRTGRASQSGVAYTFIVSHEYHSLKKIMSDTGADIQKMALSAAHADTGGPRKSSWQVEQGGKRPHSGGARRRSSGRDGANNYWQKKRRGKANSQAPQAGKIGA